MLGLIFGGKFYIIWLQGSWVSAVLALGVIVLWDLTFSVFFNEGGMSVGVELIFLLLESVSLITIS